MIIMINAWKVDETTKVEYVTNPKRAGFKAHARYEEYQRCTTIGEYLELCTDKYSRPDLRYDEDHGYLKIYDDEGNHINEKERSS